MIRQIFGSVSQFEKAMLVAKLKGACDRKTAATGKCGGRKSYAERNGEMVALAKKRHTSNGNRYSATAVSRMIASRVGRTI